MALNLRHAAFVLTPPVLAVTLLAGVVAEQRSHLKPADVEPYHARARAGIEAVPYVLNAGQWTAERDEITPAAQKLLRPNAILSLTYKENAAAHRQAILLIVQCRDSRDMVGHYPPICYRAHGMTCERFNGIPKPEEGESRDWKVNGTTITGKEYRFTTSRQGQTFRTTVYNFFIVPGHGMARDMKGVENAAEDYQQRYYGAAQFQVVFQRLASEDLTAAERDEVFTTIMAPNTSLIQTLTSGGLQ